MLTLSEIKPNQTCTVVGFVGEIDAVLRRLLELGLTVGTKVKVVATSLQKKVFLLQLKGYVLSIRTSILNKVAVKL